MMCSDDIVLKFGPQGKFSLYIPLKDLDTTAETGRSLVTAGMAIMLRASQDAPQKINDPQKLFDWMRKESEKAA